MAGILAIWNDCAPEGYDHFERWYIREHLQERVGVPGFRFGRRYEAVSAPTAASAPSTRWRAPTSSPPRPMSTASRRPRRLGQQRRRHLQPAVRLPQAAL